MHYEREYYDFIRSVAKQNAARQSRLWASFRRGRKGDVPSENFRMTFYASDDAASPAVERRDLAIKRLLNMGAREDQIEVKDA